MSFCVWYLHLTDPITISKDEMVNLVGQSKLETIDRLIDKTLQEVFRHQLQQSSPGTIYDPADTIPELMSTEEMEDLMDAYETHYSQGGSTCISPQKSASTEKVCAPLACTPAF